MIGLHDGPTPKCVAHLRNINPLQKPPRRNKNRIHNSPIRAGTTATVQEQIPVTTRLENFPHCGEKGTTTREEGQNDTFEALIHAAKVSWRIE